MPIPISHVKKAICAGAVKVLYSVDLRWNDLKDLKIAYTFTSVANPTTWKSFMEEAVATAIQQELILRGSYCPDLEKPFVDWSTADPAAKTWGDLEAFIKGGVRNCQVSF